MVLDREGIYYTLEIEGSHDESQAGGTAGFNVSVRTWRVDGSFDEGP